MASPDAGTEGEGISLPRLPEQTGMPVVFDRDIATLQTPSEA